MKIPKLIARTARLPHRAFATGQDKEPRSNASIAAAHRNDRSLTVPANGRDFTTAGTPSPRKVRRTLCGSRSIPCGVLAHAGRSANSAQTMGESIIPDSTRKRSQS